jgi:hypothetical protein
VHAQVDLAVGQAADVIRQFAGARQGLAGAGREDAHRVVQFV